MSSNRYLFDIIKNCNPGAQIQAETQIVSRLWSEGKGFLGEKEGK